MANNCYYDLKIVGTKEAIEDLIEILQYKHPVLELYRVFNADVCEEGSIDNGNCYAIICGDVAWSIISTMLKDADPNGGWTNLQRETAGLNLVVEIYSSEPGIGFQEHYIIDNGTLTVEEEEDYSEYWFDPDEWEGETEEQKFAAFCEEYDLDGADFHGEGSYSSGGFPDYGNWSI